MEKDEYYNIADDKEMQKKHLATQRLCHKFSSLDPKKLEKRKQLIKEIVNSIGDNTVVGAGSVVTKSLPANVVAAGNPCKVIKTI